MRVDHREDELETMIEGLTTIFLGCCSAGAC